jgi:hypothetical protein
VEEIWLWNDWLLGWSRRRDSAEDLARLRQASHSKVIFMSPCLFCMERH